MASIADTDRDEQEGDVSRKIEGIDFVDYRDESLLDSVMSLVGRDLSEPYSSKIRLITDYRTYDSFSYSLASHTFMSQSLPIVTFYTASPSCVFWQLTRTVQKNPLVVCWPRWI
jgi:hypothetical protein